MSNQDNRPSATVKAPFNYGYIVVMACFVIVMLNVGLFVSVGVFFKPILNEFGWSRAVTSGPISCCALVTGACSILTGLLSDKYGPRLVITACVIIAGAGYVLMSHLNSIWQLYIYLGLFTGIGSSALPSMLSSVPHWFTGGRSVMMGIISAGGGVGGLLIPLISNWLIEDHQWRTAYWILGISYLVITIIASQFLRRSPSGVKAADPGQTALQSQPSAPLSLKEIFRSGRFWLGNLVFFCIGFSALTVQFHLVNHATDIHISTTGSAGLLSILNGVSVVGSIALGGLGDKYGNRILMILTFMVICLSMVGLLFMNTLWQLDIFAIVFGMAFGAGLSNAPALVSKLFRMRFLGLILGITSLSQTLGGSLGGFLAGYVYDAQNSYKTVFILCALLCLVGMSATYLLRTGREIN